MHPLADIDAILRGERPKGKTLATRRCIEHRCPEYALPGKSRCADHQKADDRRKRDLYGPGTTPEWRRAGKAAMTRDRGSCVLCSSPDNVEVHHIDGTGIIGGNHALMNLVVLATSTTSK